MNKNKFAVTFKTEMKIGITQVEITVMGDSAMEATKDAENMYRNLFSGEPCRESNIPAITSVHTFKY